MKNFGEFFLMTFAVVTGAVLTGILLDEAGTKGVFGQNAKNIALKATRGFGTGQ